MYHTVQPKDIVKLLHDLRLDHRADSDSCKKKNADIKKVKDAELRKSLKFEIRES